MLAGSRWRNSKSNVEFSFVEVHFVGFRHLDTPQHEPLASKAVCEPV